MNKIAVILLGQDLIDSWIHKKNVDELLAECEIQDEVSSITSPGYNKGINCHEKDGGSSLYDLSHNYREDEDGILKPGN